MDTAYLKSPVGLLKIEADEKYIHSIHFYKGSKIHTTRIQNKNILQIKKELAQYFKGTRKKFAVPYKLKGTPFQVQVWKKLSRVPFSKTLSYQDLAKKAGSPKAFRAVGSACGKNHLPLIIPCHRVLNSNGELGGFSGGLNLKEKLLKLERHQ